MSTTTFRAVAAALALCVAAPAMAQTVEPEEASVEVGVGGRALLGYLPLTIAERKGFFEKEGLNVTINDFAGGSKALQALVGGSVDVVSGAYEHTILSAVKGIELEAVALQNNSFGVVIALAADKAKEYKSPKDLKGYKFGVTSPGSSSAAAVALLLDKDGLTLNDVSIIAVGGGAGAVAAMKTGQLDALSNYDPIVSVLEGDNVITPIVDTRTQEGLQELYGGPFAGSSFYVNRDFAADHPKTTQAFVNAVVDALQWMQNASTEEIVDVVPEDYYGGDKELYTVILDRNRGMFSKDGRISDAVAENVLRNVSKTNEDVAKADIDISKTYDNTFVDSALGR